MKQAFSHKVRPKKHLGQHFLNDEQIAEHIVEALVQKCATTKVLEIGPGMGVLTKYLLPYTTFQTFAIDVDKESIVYLQNEFPVLNERLIEGDFLQMDLMEIMKEPFSLIGNFPYNISSQIVFALLKNKQHIPLMVGMFQKEVAERICAVPRSKAYGIMTVLAQAYYTTEYLFTVSETVFTPPPKVKSAVMRLIRKEQVPDVDEQWLYRVVKTAFNQRRKKLRNALQPFHLEDDVLKETGFMDKRAEELTLSDFIALTKVIMTHGKSSDRPALD